jgi:hypothetical protein
MITVELSLSNVTDAEVFPNLLKQTRRRIIKMSGDVTYYTRDGNDAIRIKRAVTKRRHGILGAKLSSKVTRNCTALISTGKTL